MIATISSLVKARAHDGGQAPAAREAADDRAAVAAHAAPGALDVGPRSALTSVFASARRVPPMCAEAARAAGPDARAAGPDAKAWRAKTWTSAIAPGRKLGVRPGGRARRARNRPAALGCDRCDGRSSPWPSWSWFR